MIDKTTFISYYDLGYTHRVTCGCDALDWYRRVCIDARLTHGPPMLDEEARATEQGQKPETRGL